MPNFHKYLLILKSQRKIYIIKWEVYQFHFIGLMQEKGIEVRYEGRGLKLVTIRILQNLDAVLGHCNVTSAHTNSQLRFLSPLLSPVIPQSDSRVTV